MRPRNLRSRLLIAVLRVAISAALLVFVLILVDLRAVASSLHRISLLPYALGVALHLAATVVTAYRWRLLLVAKRLVLPLRRTVHLYFVGRFYGLAMPTAVGGDVVRGYYAALDTGRRADAMASVIVERLTGLAGLLVIGLVAWPFLWPRRPPIAAGVLLGACGGLVLLLGALAHPRMQDSLSWILQKARIPRRLSTGIERLYEAIHRYRSSGRTVAAAVSISLFSQSLDILSFFAVALSLSVRVPLASCFAFMPAIWIASMFPLSLSGIGVRETLTVALFGSVGLDPPEVLAVALAWSALLVATSLLGGPLQLYENVRCARGGLQHQPTK